MKLIFVYINHYETSYFDQSDEKCGPLYKDINRFNMIGITIRVKRKSTVKKEKHKHNKLMVISMSY